MTVFIIFIALAAVFALYAFLLAPGRYPKAAPAALWQARYAHRGLHDRENIRPENSLAAFADAVEAGYGIELDIRLTADDQAVVFHDDNLKRVCGVDRDAADCTYEELQGYRLSGTEQRIPLFTEVLSRVDGRAPLIIELKSTKRNQALCEKAAAILDVYNGPYCVESFHPGIVAWFKKHRPQVVRGQLTAGYRQYGTLPGWQKLLLSSMLANVSARPHFVAFRHEDARGRLGLRICRLLGGKLVGWTVRDTDDIAWCERFFDVIIFEYFRP
jgi:glycerophosphoryl diester phosphodiesterase